MSKKTIVLVAILIAVIFWVWFNRVKSYTLQSPSLISTFNKQIPSPTVVLSNAPKTFKFDSSTDLKKQLDNINPQVLDSDFE